MARIGAVAWRVGAPLVLMLALAGFGSSSRTIATSSRATAFASEPPTQILAASFRGLDSEKSVRVSGTLQASNFPRGNFILDVVFPSRLAMTVDRGQTQEQIILVPPEIDLRANLAYWDSKASEAIAREYANRWLTIEGSQGVTLLNEFEALLKTLATESVACNLARYPHPTIVGTATVDGQPSVEVHSTGPSGRDSLTIYIATAPPHLPVKIDATRPAAESALRSCPGIPGAKAGTADASYSGWNTVTITAPAHVTKLS